MSVQISYPWLNCETGTIVNPPSPGSVYYVKNAGSDANTGLSDAQAFATAAHANIHVVAGDSVLFNRGDTWREQISTKAGTSGDYTYYGAYGLGAKPKFLGSKQENNTSDWVNQGGNIWQNSDASFTVDVANIVFNNEESCGVKLMTATPTFTTQGQFWYDFTNDRIRMYSVGNPASFYTNIECVLMKDGLFMAGNYDYITVQNLDFRYWGYNVVEWQGNYINYLDLDMSYIGGGDQNSDYNIRLGNGIQIWEGQNDITIEGCRIDNCYDAGISPQGYASGYTLNNIYIRNNIITNCEYGYEFYERTGSTTHDVYFENNTIVNSGGGWGHNQRPDGVRGCSIRIGLFSGTISSNVYIRNNIFYEATEAIFLAWYVSDLSKITIDNNLYYQSSGSIGYQQSNSHSYATFADWQTAISQEVHGVNANPLFVSTTDFHLQAGSPAIDTGINVSVMTDFDGHQRPYNLLYDIGVYEFGYN